MISKVRYTLEGAYVCSISGKKHYLWNSKI